MIIRADFNRKKKNQNDFVSHQFSLMPGISEMTSSFVLNSYPYSDKN